MASSKFGRNLRGESSVESVIPIGESRSIRVTTSKASKGGVSCHATVVLDEGDVFSFVIFQDFSKTLVRGTGRATEACLRSTHDAGLAELPKHAAAIEAQYPGTKVVV